MKNWMTGLTLMIVGTACAADVGAGHEALIDPALRGPIEHAEDFAEPTLLAGSASDVFGSVGRALTSTPGAGTAAEGGEHIATELAQRAGPDLVSCYRDAPPSSACGPFGAIMMVAECEIGVGCVLQVEDDETDGAATACVMAATQADLEWIVDAAQRDYDYWREERLVSIRVGVFGGGGDGSADCTGNCTREEDCYALGACHCHQNQPRPGGGQGVCAPDGT